MPDAVAELVAATTGPDGLAVIDAVATDDLLCVDVRSREFGVQGRPLLPRPAGPAVVALRPVATWKGRLSAEDPEHARGWRVRAWTRVGGAPNEAPQTYGYAETTTDDEGRFTLAPIAVGLLQLDLKPPGDLPVQADLPQRLVVREGREDSADIPLKKTATVTGLILERGTGKPVPGVSVTLFAIGEGRNGGRTVKTDERGRYTFQSLPGPARLSPSFPTTHVQAPDQGWEDFTVPEPPRVVELATKEALPSAPPLRGRVVDGAGRAVPGATVQGSWTRTGGGGTFEIKADAAGNFVVEGLAPGSAVTVTARLRDQRTKKPVTVRAGEAFPVTVAIAPAPVLAVAGRLLGPGGASMAGAPVVVQFRARRDNVPGFPEPVRFEGEPEIKAAPDGTFRTPKELDRKPGEFRVEVSLEGFLPARTAWVPVPDGDLLTLPDLTVKRSRGSRVVSGRVVDRDGKAVPGASVSQAGDGPRWTSARADADGRFHLPGVAGGEALVFAEAPGFRFGGAVVGGVADPVEVRLARTGEPPIATLKPLPSPLPRTEERALARELLEPLLSPARADALGVYMGEVIPALARVDPARVLDMIEERTVAEPSRALIQAALGQFEDDPAAAVATVQNDLDPGSRAAAWLALAGFRPAPARARREEFLGRALADARLARGSDVKVALLGRVADHWLELGSLEKARPILLEGQGVVAAVPEDTWYSEAGGFAEVLAAIDLPAALAVFERPGGIRIPPAANSSLNRHNGEAAVRLAGVDPAGAERLIAPPSVFFYERPGIVLGVARRMAGVDPARARRVLETVDDPPDAGAGADPALVPFGLGLIADGLAATDPARARGLLDEAYDGLRKLAADGQPGPGRYTAPALMAELLPVVERLDPGRLAERAWLAAASRPPSVQDPTAQDVTGAFALAMRVARYDRSLADVIAAPALERLPDLLVGSSGPYGGITPMVLKCLTAYDPRAIRPLLRALPESVRTPLPRTDAVTAGGFDVPFRLAVAQTLGLPNEVRSREAGRSGPFALYFRPGD